MFIIYYNFKYKNDWMNMSIVQRETPQITKNLETTGAKESRMTLKRFVEDGGQ
jgi:hypothetical protein